MSKRTVEQATNTKERIYQFIIKHIAENSFAPTVREIGKSVGLQSTATVYNYLQCLEKEGRIEIKKGSSRAIKVICQKKETVESLELKKQVSNDMRECLIESGNFDTDMIQEIMEVFDKTAEQYIFHRKEE